MKNFTAILLMLFAVFNCYAASNHHPTIVLVHGALLTSSSWAPVQSYLQNHGYNVVTIDTPGRANDKVMPGTATLSAATNKLCAVIVIQNEPVMVVGHSQAGAIITEATNICGSHIKGLVYVAAVIPLSGEKAFDLLSEQDNHNFDITAPVNNDTGLAEPDFNAPIKTLFMGDANDADAKRAINNIVPEPVVFGTATLHYDTAAFNNIPKFYIKTASDMIISPQTQDKYIGRQKLDGVFVLDTSHSPFVSKPHLLGQRLAFINDSLSR